MRRDGVDLARHGARGLGGLALTAALLLSRSAGAVVLSEDAIEETSTELGVVARSFGFLFSGPVLRPPYSLVDSDPSASAIFDARLYFGYESPHFKLTAHNQLSLRVASHADLGIIPLGRGLPPPRWLPLSVQHDDPTLNLSSQGDWIYAAYTAGPVTISLGRQPITFGRGTLWRTADRISTFALTEIDTEYKPGSDALRIDANLAEQTQLVVVASIGELESEEHDAEVELRGSSFVAQLKQGWESGELGIIGGFVRYDAMLGVDAVLDLGDLDLYGELTATRVTAKSLSTPVVDDRRVPRFSALLGATLKPADTLTIKPEAFYNGFGSFDRNDYLAIALSERVAIGEQVGLGALYAGITNDWEAYPLTHVVTSMVANLRDPSALVSLAVQHNLAQNVDWLVGGYVPMGYLPDTQALRLRSEYGNFPYFFFSELRGTL